MLGSPGVYDPGRDALVLTGALPGWDRPSLLADLREAFGSTVMIENDVDAAALAELAHGHGREVDTFAFVSVGTGVGMGLVLDGRLHRGAHGAAGEIGFMPFADGTGVGRAGRPPPRHASRRRRRPRRSCGRRGGPGCAAGHRRAGLHGRGRRRRAGRARWSPPRRGWSRARSPRW